MSENDANNYLKTHKDCQNLVYWFYSKNALDSPLIDV